LTGQREFSSALFSLALPGATFAHVVGCVIPQVVDLESAPLGRLDESSAAIAAGEEKGFAEDACRPCPVRSALDILGVTKVRIARLVHPLPQQLKNSTGESGPVTGVDLIEPAREPRKFPVTR